MASRLDASAFAAQPLAVDEIGAGDFGTQLRPAETLDRLEIERVRLRPVA
jgi:hypothetical protein